jgi:hypothetical protein
MISPDARRVSWVLVPSLVRYQRRSRYDVIATRESRMCGWSRNSADSFAARARSSSLVSSGGTSTASSLTSGFTSDHTGGGVAPTPPAVRASSLARSWTSASL